MHHLAYAQGPRIEDQKKRTMQLTVRKRLSCDNDGKKDMGKFIIPATCGNVPDIKLHPPCDSRNQRKTNKLQD